MYPFFRFFIELVKIVFFDGKTWKFFVVLMIGILAFTSALFLLALKNGTVDLEADKFTYGKK
jgi:hypothetical protein